MSTRRVLLILGLVGVLAGGVYVAYRRGWIFREGVNEAEVARAQAAALKVPEPGKDWPQWRGPTRDGRAPVGPLRTDWAKNPPKTVWTAGCGGGYSSCAVTAGRVYTQDFRGGNERVFCLDAGSGELTWEYQYPADYKSMQYAGGPRATPLIDGNRVYAVGAVGKFVCLEAPPGGKGQPRLVWEHDLLSEFDAELPTWGVACSPLLEGDLVIVQPGGKKGSVAAFDKNSGALRWAAGSNPSGYSSPVAGTVRGRRLVFAFTGDSLLALGTDGRVLDSYRMRTDYLGNIATPLVINAADEDYVFVSAAYGMGSALLRVEVSGDGAALVKVYPPRAQFKNHHASSVLKDRYLFGFDGDSTAFLKCVAFDNCEEKWDAERDVGKGTLILADRHLVIQTERGELCLVEATPDEFRLVAKVPRVLSGNNNWATPTLLDGRLYLRDEQKIVCLDVRP